MVLQLHACHARGASLVGCMSSMPHLLVCREGNLVKEIAALPLADDIPIAFNSCRKGPRSVHWRDDRPHELTWIECQACPSSLCVHV